jgi:hypothetical protein
MRKTAIQTGVLYAYQSRSKIVAPDPLVFLSTSLYSSRGQAMPREAWAHAAVRGTSIGISNVSRVRTGYLAVVPTYSGRPRSAETILQQRMQKVTLEQALRQKSFDVDDDLRLEIVISLTRVLGPYGEIMAERGRQEEARRLQREREQAEQRVAEGVRQELISRFAALGISVFPEARNPGLITVTPDEADKILRRLSC